MPVDRDPTVVPPFVRFVRLATLLLAAWGTAVLAYTVATVPGYPGWDCVAHGFDGVRLARLLETGQWVAAARALWTITPWPPLYPLVEAVFVLAFGRAPIVTYALMPAWFFGLCLAFVWLGRALDPTDEERARAGGAPEIGTWVAAASVALAVSSPLVRLLGMSVMIELPAAMVTVLALAAWAHAERSRRPGLRVLACVLVPVLFLLKYNYALLLAIPVVVLEIAQRLPPRGARAARLRVWLRFGRAAGEGEPRTWSVSATTRAFALFGALPVVAWLLDPRHLKNVVRYLVEDEFAAMFPTRPPLERLLYYPREMLGDYSPNAVVGLLAMLFAALAVVRMPKLPSRVKPLVWVMAVDLAGTVLHRLQFPRFLLTMVPLLWLSAAWAAADLVTRAFRGRRMPARLLPAASLAALVLAASLGLRVSDVRALYRSEMAPAALGRMLDAIADLNHGARGTLLIGTWNRLSTPLVEWGQWLHLGPDARPSRCSNPLWYAKRGGVDETFRAVDADSSITRVIAVRCVSPPQWAADQDAENPWQRVLADRFGADPHWRLERDRDFLDGGYVMRVYARTTEVPTARAAAGP